MIRIAKPGKPFATTLARKALLAKLPLYNELPVTRAELDALRSRVTELEARLVPVTKLSNAAKQKAYRARRKANG